MQIRNLKHNTRVGLKGGKGIAIVVAWLAGFVGAALAADDTVTITFTTMSATGGYSPRNVHVVYLTDTAGRFVTTVGNGTGTKRALCGNARAHDILQWFTGNPSAQSDIDARTGATETAYKTYAIAWNWTKRDGSVVPDGTYKLKFELTDDNSNKNKFNRTDLTVTKGRPPGRSALSPRADIRTLSSSTRPRASLVWRAIPMRSTSAPRPWDCPWTGPSTSSILGLWP